MESSVVINDLERARELVSSHIKELYRFKSGKVAELEDLIRYLEDENIEKGTILTVLSDVDELSRLGYDKDILVGIRPQKIVSSTVLIVDHPVYSFCEGPGTMSFVEKYKSVDNSLQRNNFKEVVRKMFNFYYKRKTKQQNIV
jgi:hypothetical protein